MPNNVYIGSRYVPIFKGVWNATLSYEALTIVEYGNNSFTSKRPVPLNTPPTTGDDNDPYWVLTGNYNGQIAHLQDQIDDNTSDITALTKQLTHNVIFIGDSYSGTFGSFTKGIASATQLRSGLDNNHFHIYQKGGAGYIGHSQGKSFDDLLDDAIADITNPNDITDIVVAGGCNDAGASVSQADLNAAYNTWISKAHNAFPNAIIRPAVVGGFFNVNQRQYLVKRVCGCIYYPLNMYFVKPVHNLLTIMMCAYCFTDNVHPIEWACRFMGDMISQAIFGNENPACDYDLGFTTITKSSAISTINSANFTSQFKDNGLEVNLMSRLELTGDFSVMWNTGLLLEIGTLNGKGLYNNVVDDNSTPSFRYDCDCWIYDGTSGDYQKLASAQLFVMGNTSDMTQHLYLHIPIANKNYLNYTMLKIMPKSWFIPNTAFAT